MKKPVEKMKKFHETIFKAFGITNQGSDDKYKMINLFSFNQNTETNRKQIIK